MQHQILVYLYTAQKIRILPSIKMKTSRLHVEENSLFLLDLYETHTQHLAVMRTTVMIVKVVLTVATVLQTAK